MKIKNNKFDEWGELYEHYHNLSLSEFQKLCCDYIKKSSVSSNEKKYRTITLIREKRNKDEIVKLVTNFYLSGEGLKVL